MKKWRINGGKLKEEEKEKSNGISKKRLKELPKARRGQKEC
jgi:hypothetical protein